jgi:hypothetical protein
MASHPRVTEISVSKTQRTEEQYFEEPVQDDGDAAEEEAAADRRRDDQIVEHDKPQRQHRGRAHDVQRIGQRNKAPLRGGQPEGVTNHYAENDKVRQDAQKKRDAIPEQIAFEAKIEADEQCGGRRQRVMRRNQRIAQRQILETHHAADR